jgi:regulatory protein
VDRGLQSDARYAEAFVHQRTQKGYGPIRIQQELRVRGISDELITQHLDPNDPGWHELLASVCRKRFGPSIPRSPRERARQWRFLERRGFTGDQIRKALNVKREA